MNQRLVWSSNRDINVAVILKKKWIQKPEKTPDSQSVKEMKCYISVSVIIFLP